MRRSNSQQHDLSRVAYGDGGEPEAPKPQAEGTAIAEHKPRCGSPWDITMPADLEAERPSQPFQEPMRGLALREVVEPDIFRHFFGASVAKR